MHGHRERPDHRGDRSGRRLHELLARDIPYWATSMCALDADGPLAALVVNQATGVVRYRGARRRRVP